MSAPARFWLLRGGEVVAALTLVTLLHDPTREAAPRGTAVALGVIVAAALSPLGLLARPRVQISGPIAASALGCYLSLRAAIEEVAWRLAVTGRVAAASAWPLGLAVGTLGFALSHAGAGRTAVLTHILTGLAFGAVYLETGRLLASVVAHSAYNLVVLGATLHRRS